MRERGRSRFTLKGREWAGGRSSTGFATGRQPAALLGCPIPVIHCEACGIVPVPEKDLPVVLPEDLPYTRERGNPLARRERWLRVPCPSCGKPGRRETDTFDTFVESSWYFLRYIDPKNDLAPLDPEKMRRFAPVDQYVGGVEHACMHLIYAPLLP